MYVCVMSLPAMSLRDLFCVGRKGRAEGGGFMHGCVQVGLCKSFIWTISLVLVVTWCCKHQTYCHCVTYNPNHCVAILSLSANGVRIV